jgi:hypothetical protein
MIRSGASDIICRAVTSKSMSNDSGKHQTIESTFAKILGHEAILMPMGTDVFTSQKIWPDALVAHYHQNIAKMGSIESHGSLWKLIHRKDNHVGYRVMLQASVSSCNVVILLF